jgi:hypothetical protein
MAARRLDIYKKALFFEPSNLLNPLWRRDILAAEKDRIDMLFVRIQMGQSQEAIIEKTLSKYIDSKSPYFDSDREKEGRLYGEIMINNVIDIFGSVFECLNWTRNTVVNYGAEIKNESLKPQIGDLLTGPQVKSFAEASSEMLKQLDALKIEIEKLKEFYTR